MILVLNYCWIEVTKHCFSIWYDGDLQTFGTRRRRPQNLGAIHCQEKSFLGKNLLNYTLKPKNMDKQLARLLSYLILYCYKRKSSLITFHPSFHFLPHCCLLLPLKSHCLHIISFCIYKVLNSCIITDLPTS